MWKEISNRYKNNPAVAGYDTLNEPGEKAELQKITIGIFIMKFIKK